MNSGGCRSGRCVPPYCGLSMSTTMPNFVTVRQPAAELLRFVEKFKMAASAILNLFGNSGPPMKFTYDPEVAQKIWYQSNFYFSRYRNFKILKIWLKTPIQAPKFTFLGVLTPKCYFSLLRPPKGTSLAGNTPFEPSTVAV